MCLLQTPRLCDTLQKYINEMGVGDFVGARFLLPQYQPGSAVEKVPEARVTTKHVEVNLHKFEKRTDPATFDEKAFYNKRRWSGAEPVGVANGAIAAPPGGFKWNRAFLFDVVFTAGDPSRFRVEWRRTKGVGFLSSRLLNSTEIMVVNTKHSTRILAAVALLYRVSMPRSIIYCLFNNRVRYLHVIYICHMHTSQIR